MGGPSEQVADHTLEQICDVNRRMIESSGGRFVLPYNLHRQGALEYILAAVSLPLYGEFRHPSLKEKAAAIAYHSITRHVFFDGNKRTAIHTAWEFLKSNRIALLLEPTINELAVAIASGEAGYGALLRWLHEHQ